MRADYANAGRLHRLSDGALAALVSTCLAALAAVAFLGGRYSLLAIFLDALLLLPLSMAIALAALASHAGGQAAP